MPTLKAKEMRTLAAENNKEELIETIRNQQIDPEIEKSAKDGRFYCYWSIEEKYKDYKHDISRSLRKDGFRFEREKTVLGKEMFKISWH